MYIVSFGAVSKQNGTYQPDGSCSTDDRWFHKLSQAAKAWEDDYDLKKIFNKEWDTNPVKPRNRGYYVALEEWTTDSDGEPLDLVDTLGYRMYTYDDYEVYCDLPF